MGVNKRTDDKGREKVECLECGEFHHRLDVHLKKHDMRVAAYKEKHPGALTISKAASAKAREAGKKAMEKRMGGAKPAKVAKAKPPKGKDDSDAFKIGVARLYERSGLSKDDKHHVPVHDPCWMPGLREMDEWELLAIGIQDKHPVYLHGPTGCGKSVRALELASALNQPCVRFQGTQQAKESTIIGKTDLVVDEESGEQVTRWTDGLLPKCMRNGWWILVDEFTALPPGILFAFQAVLEGNQLMLPSGEVVTPHEHFRIIATDNTAGRGDDSGLYAGTHVMNEATMDRFGIVIASDYPEPEHEARILVTKGDVDPKVAEKMVACANKVREAAANETCFCTFSLRRLIAWARLTTRLGDVRKASAPAVLNKLSKEDSEFVDSIIQRYFGGDI